MCVPVWFYDGLKMGKIITLTEALVITIILKICKFCSSNMVNGVGTNMIF